ncbi:MAG TPA: hypothetical protein VEA58_00660 [Anaerovoracaceae bacterium]|nr:hypothetical protein [Anaerovoracaceae bacterium]
MKPILFTIIVLGCCFSAACQEKPDTIRAVFTPPVIVKDKLAKTDPATTPKCVTPHIVKHKSAMLKKSKDKQAKFKPPLILKNPE